MDWEDWVDWVDQVEVGVDQVEVGVAVGVAVGVVRALTTFRTSAITSVLTPSGSFAAASTFSQSTEVNESTWSAVWISIFEKQVSNRRPWWRYAG